MVGAYADKPEEQLDTLTVRIGNNPTVYPDQTIFIVGNEVSNRNQADSRTPKEYVADLIDIMSRLRAINPTYQFALGPVILSQNSLAVTFR